MLLPRPIAFAALIVAFVVGHILIWLERGNKSPRNLSGQGPDAEELLVSERLA